MGAKEREEQYKAIIQERRQYKIGGHRIVLLPRCVRCVERHRPCPGPELDANGECDFSRKCLRCSDMVREEVECDWQGERTDLYVAFPHSRLLPDQLLLHNTQVLIVADTSSAQSKKLEGMTEEELKKVKKAGTDSKTPKLSSHRLPAAPPPKKAAVNNMPPYQSSSGEARALSLNLRGQVRKGLIVDEVNHPTHGTNFVIQSTAPNQLPEAEAPNQTRSHSPQPEHTSHIEEQDLNPPPPNNSPATTLYDTVHQRFGFTNQADINMRDMLQGWEAALNDRTRLAHQAAAELDLKEAALQKQETELQEERAALTREKARLQQIEDHLQAWQVDLQEREAALDETDARRRAQMK
jgi:hypothetical protein